MNKTERYYLNAEIDKEIARWLQVYDEADKVMADEKVVVGHPVWNTRTDAAARVAALRWVKSLILGVD